MQNPIRESILNYANERESFIFSELFASINQKRKVSKVTLSWYLKDLIKQNKIVKTGRGIYSKFNVSKQTYQPFIRDTGIKVGKELSKHFPLVNFNILDGQTYVRFQHNISQNMLYYIEVERDVMETFFNFIKDLGYDAYLDPDENFIYYNVDSRKEAFIIKPYITESPLMEYEGLMTPTLEKIIVDIPCDKDLFYLQDLEWSYMLETIMSDYNVNITRMLRYASRRNFKEKLKESLNRIGTDD